MRYRIFFPKGSGQAPIEIDGCRFEFHPKAQRRLRLYRGEPRSVEDCIDLFLAARPTKITDDHGRLVWSEPTESIIAALFRKFGVR